MEDNMNALVESNAAEELVEKVAESASSEHAGLKVAALVGGSMALGAVLWERVVKPVGRKLKSAVKKAKAKKHKSETDEAEGIDMDEINVEEDNYDI